MYKTIALLGAMPEEVDLIIKALSQIKSEIYGGVCYHVGQRAGVQVVVCFAGIGKANAAATTQVLITRYGAEAIIFSGIAGNMSNEIGIGDVVIGETLCYHDAEERTLVQSAPGTALYSADFELINIAKEACRLVDVRHIVGKIATGDQFVGDSDTKKRIQEECAPDCVEMEGAAVGHIAMRNAVPFVVVRAMSDNSDQSVEALGGKEFKIDEYVQTAAAIVLAMVDKLGANKLP